MKKEHRLKKNWEFEKVMRSNHQLVNRHIIIYYLKSNSFKAGITVPKKFAGSVGRNFYKRQLRAIIHELDIYDLNYQFVFIVRKDFLTTDFAVKQKSIAKLMEKLRNETKQK
ncbi:ribonuclease P protein component [Mycoplasmopsis pullorum]|uniref:Ribonuclease P protein component n=1 Tax=Mycoplasmopsis pullorum TaxID=48003 RepID=A0A1L4FRX7_9BACT|nr:ribonuclease P protein component [Mycoplasmopsis pullorum]APJ38363.1 ribonuclease P protein component [Mycoplasmopsis pullorum]TNK81985.1 ribonuclease P protein component [Mycoplasmopsis pullorum]TNK81988.1 ribonuclease P protein component [Mycoplasmopsis pullorum]TNK84457.1 ribonuclease P protein component [Mycoplasmopsis pullorum]TNK84613.1 ribonuclease P protein component [Mycoplasmopsis pullorum]